MTRIWKLTCGSAMLVLVGAVCSISQAAVVTLADAPYPHNSEVFTFDPHSVTNANRGFDTTRELRQTFKNPTTFDVRKIVVSVDVNKTTGGWIFDIWEVPDVNASPITTEVGVGNPVNGTLFHSITIPAGTYTNSGQRTGILLSGDDVFTLPQRDAGTTGYALAIRQINTAETSTGVWVFANNGTDNYLDGKIYIETGNPSSATRDAGLAISSTPEPTSVGLVLVGLCCIAVGRRGRSFV